MNQDELEFDKGLLQQIQKQEESALEKIYDRYSRLVFSLALRIIGIQADAEETTQEVFLKIWKSARNFDPSKGSSYTWIMTMTRRMAIDKIRLKSVRNHNTQPLLDYQAGANSLISEESDASGHMILKEQAEIVKIAVNRLSKEDRTVIELAYFRGLTHSQIAKTLQQPLGTIKSRLRNGIVKLKNNFLAKATM